MEIQKKLITPAKAVELLQSNVKNRRPKNPVVLKYAKEIIIKTWNLFRSKQVLKFLKYTPSTDTFPKAI